MSLRHEFLLAAALFIAAPAVPVRANVCTAAQGDILIEEGRYKQAVKEFRA